MNPNRSTTKPTAGVLLVVLALLAGACGGGERTQEGLTGTILVDGSSTVYPLSEAVGEEFTLANPNVRVPVGVSGTGGGFSKFLRGETDINDASRPIKPSEHALAEQNGVDYIELPVVYDGLAVIAHPENDWLDCLTAAELRRIWEPGSEISRWSQVRDGFPDQPIVLYGPGTDSGTYDYFTEAVNGEEGASRSDFTASEDDNVLVQGIVGDRNALGFFGLAYYEENRERLKLIGIDDEDPANGDGCVLPSEQTVRDGTYQPLSRPLFIYVRADRAQDATVRAFVDFYLENAGPLAQEVGYVPLTDRARQLVQQRFAQGITGSLFAGGGSQVGVNIESLMSDGMAPDTTAAL